MIRIFLTFASLLLIWVFIGPIRGAQHEEPTLPDGRWPLKATGVGETEQNARDDAIRAAVKEINRLMQEQNPPLVSFEVTREYVRKNLLVDDGRPGKEIEIEGFKQKFKEWVLTFRTDENWWKDIVRLDQAAKRQNSADARHSFALRMVIGLSTLLLGSFGYTRFNEYTKHQYATWLRAASVAVLSVAALVLAGWWLL